MKHPVDMPTELLITTLNANSELAILAAAWAGNYDSRKNGKRFKGEVDKITDRQRAAANDIIKRHAPELLSQPAEPPEAETWSTAPLHFTDQHFTAVTIKGRKFLYCPVDNICSWSEGDYDNKWCHACKKFFEELK